MLQATQLRTCFLAAALVLALPATLLAQEQRPASNVTRVNQGEVAYRWSRGGRSIPFTNRNGRWTQAEAVRFGAALDQLPDGFIRKAIAGGMQKIHRDGRLPQAPWDVLSSPRDSLSGVAVPPAPWHYVAVGDNLFTKDDAAFAQLVCHELAHCVQWSLSGWATITVGTSGWTGISWTTGVPGTGLKSWNGFPSNYAKKNHMEDFAEAAEWYWFTPSALYRASPAKYNYMRTVVFDGLSSPTSIRAEREPTERVVPVITRLGDASDDRGSVVQIHGEHFMAPYDGGFNRVEYRGTRANHLPISRTRITSFVPGISEGSAPITVTTQDGKSAPAAFKVDKPWWKFW